MRLGALTVLACIATVIADRACADGIVKIVNAAKAGVTVRIDGGFACRAESPVQSPDSVEPDHCSFGATVGSHALEFDFDDSKTEKKTINVPANGLTLTLTGND